MKKHKIINKNYLENENFYLISASHNGYEKKFGYIHERSIKILKKENKIYGQDILKKTAGNSVLISLPNGEGGLLECKTKSLDIEKNIFLGNKNKIMNNESISISGEINKELISIEWQIERLN